MKIKTTLIVLASLLVLAACSSNKTKTPRANYYNFIESEELKKVSKITQFRMTRWQPLDHQFFILNASRKRNYLIEVTGYCPDLKYSHTLRLIQSMSSSLQSKFDSVVVDSDPNQKCTIKTIYPLTPEQKIRLTSDDPKISVQVKKEL